MFRRFLPLLLFAGLVACQQPITPDQGDLAPLPTLVPERIDNPSSPEKIALGKLLFFDPILSGPKTVSCASCHAPNQAFGDGQALSGGVGTTPRNSPTLLNVAFNGLTADGWLDQAEAPMFWDHRKRGLEAQALGPLLAADEMRGEAYAEADAMDSLVQRLQRIPAYVSLFEAAFPEESPIQASQLGQALAVYQRTLITPDSRFDRYLRGETNAMNQTEITGMQQFIRAGCATCHGGPMLSDFKLHVLGVADHPGVAESDRGDGQDRFRTPTLRNVTRTAPYMHNGTQATLEEVFQFYNDQQSLHPVVRDNQLAQEFLDLRGLSNRRRDQIIAFLGALEDDPADLSVPSEVPSGLPLP